MYDTRTSRNLGNEAPLVLRDLTSGLAYPFSQSFDLSPLVRCVNSLVGVGVAPSLEFAMSAEGVRSCRVDDGEGRSFEFRGLNSRCLFGADLSWASIKGDISGIDFSGSMLVETYFDVSAAQQARIIAPNYVSSSGSTCIFEQSGNFKGSILGGTFQNTDFRGNWTESRSDSRRLCSFINCDTIGLPSSLESREYQPPLQVGPLELNTSLPSEQILELLGNKDLTALVYGDTFYRTHNMLFTSHMVAGALEELFRRIDVIYFVKPVCNPGYPNHTHSGLLMLSPLRESVIAVVTDDETRLALGPGRYLSTLFEIPLEVGRGIQRILEQVDSRFCAVDYPERMVSLLITTLLSPLSSSSAPGERAELYVRDGSTLTAIEGEVRLQLLSQFRENLFDLARANGFFAAGPSHFDIAFSETLRRIFGDHSYDSNF